jgi:hypothetical protein
VSAGTAACFGFVQIGLIGGVLVVPDGHHVASSVSDDGILVCGGIVKELLASRHGVLGGFCLGRGYCAERCEHGRVDCTFIVEEGTYHFLYEFLLGG